MNMKKPITRQQVLSIIESFRSQGKTLSPNSNIIREYKSTLTGLTSIQQEAGIGHLLGDARIEPGKSGKGHLLKFEYGNMNKDYAFHTYNMYENYCLTPPREQKRVNVNGNVNVTWCFQTMLHSDFDYLGNLFLDDKKQKRVPVELFEQGLITSLTLARWFMDDGGMNGSHSHGIQFHTQSFTDEQVNKMVSGLNSRYHFYCWKGSNKGKPVINVPASSYRRFLDTVEKHIHPSMMKKFRIR